MLSQLDKNAPILLENLERALGTSLVTSLEDFTLFLLVFDVGFGIQRSTVTVLVSARFPELKLLNWTYSLMQTANPTMTRPVRSVASYAFLMSSVKASAVAVAAVPAEAKRINFVRPFAVFP